MVGYARSRTLGNVHAVLDRFAQRTIEQGLPCSTSEQSGVLGSWASGNVLKKGPPMLYGEILGGLLILLVVVAWSTMRYIPNNRIGIVEKLWSDGRVADGRRGHRLARRGRLPGRHHPRRHPLRPLAMAICHSQVPADHDQAGQDRLCLLPRRRKPRTVADLRRDRRVQQFSGRPQVPRAWRAKRPAAGHPPRRRVCHQHRAVQRDHRRPRLHSGICQEPGGVAASTPATERLQPADHLRQVRRDRHRDGPRRSHAAAGRTDRPRRGDRQGPAQLPQQLSRHRGLPAGRRAGGACSIRR